MQVISTIYYGRHVHTKAVLLMIYVIKRVACACTDDINIMQYIGFMQLKHTRPTLSPCLVHRRPVNHPHLRSQADLPRSILPPPDHRRCHL